LHKILSMKNVRIQGKRRLCTVQIFYGQRGFFKCGRPHFFGQKASDISKFMVRVRTDKRGGEVESMRTFCGHGGSIFCNFVRTSFIDGLLLCYTIIDDIAMLRVSAEKFSRWGNGKKQDPKNSTIKPPYTISVSCMKIRGGTRYPPAPRCLRPCTMLFRSSLIYVYC